MNIFTRISKGFFILLVLLTLSFTHTSAVSADGVFLPVGTEGFSSGSVAYTSIALNSSDLPFVAYADFANGGKTTVMKFNGTTWEVVGTAGFSAGETNHVSLVLDASDVPYVVYKDIENGNKATVMKFNGSTWEVVGTAGFSTAVVEYPSIELDTDGVPYVAYKDSNGGINKVIVMKFNGSTWEDVGPIGFSAGGVDRPTLALNTSDEAYVAYVDYANGNKATVMKFNGTTWEVVGTEGFSAGQINNPSLVLDASDVPYVVFTDNANESKTTVMKFNGSTWEVVGTPGFSAAAAFSFSFDVDASGVPYVMYVDNANGGKATVKKFNGSTWEVVGTEGFSAAAADHLSLILDTNGFPYVSYQDTPNGSKATVMMYIGVPTIYSFSGDFIEPYSDDGSLMGSRTISLTNDTFVNAGGTLTEGVHYTLTNNPAGLTPVMSIDENGFVATLTFTGNATSPIVENSVENLTITFLNGAFTDTAVAADVDGYTNDLGQITFVTHPFQGTTILYGADGAGSNSGVQLYTLDPTTGEILTTIGLLGHNINGMDFHPTTGILYGNTGTDPDGSQAKSLFNIDPTSAATTYLGTIKNAGGTALAFPDIAFRDDGRLYARGTWNDSPYLFTIATTCPSNVCLATPVAELEIGQGGGGGIDFDSEGNLYILETEDSTYGVLTVNPDTGEITEQIVYANPSVDERVMMAAKFEGNGLLFATRSTYGQSPADLVTVDVNTGVITSTGDNNDAMIFMTALAFKLTPAETPEEPVVEEEEPRRRSGGGGSSGSSSSSSTPTPSTTPTTPHTPTTSSAASLPSLTLGSAGISVTTLQQILIAQGYSIPAGATGYFGEQTRLALVQFQVANNITPAVGFFGPVTKSALTGATSAPASTPTVSSTSTGTRSLMADNVGPDVKALQIFLNTHGYQIATTGPGSPGNESDYFGNLTQDALIKFQIANNILPAYGFYGPVTQAAVKRLDI